MGQRVSGSPLPPPSRSGAPRSRQATRKSISGVDVGAGSSSPPRLSSHSAPYHSRKSYFKAAVKKPLIFAEAGSLPFNPGRAGVQVPWSGGIRRSLPFVRAVIPRRPCPGEPHRPAGLLVWAIHRGILNFAATESLHGQAGAALFVLRRTGPAKGRSRGRAPLSPLPLGPVARVTALRGSPAPAPIPALRLGRARPRCLQRAWARPSARPLTLGTLPSHGPGTLPGVTCCLPVMAPAMPPLQPACGYGTRWSRERGGREKWGSHTPLLGQFALPGVLGLSGPVSRCSCQRRSQPSSWSCCCRRGGGGVRERRWWGAGETVVGCNCPIPRSLPRGGKRAEIFLLLQSDSALAPSCCLQGASHGGEHLRGPAWVQRPQR